MRDQSMTVAENRPIARDTYRLQLRGDTAAITAPGQFVNIKLGGFYLRRPLSVCDWDDQGMTLLYKVMGRGTEVLSGMGPGAELELLSGLGNGFDTEKTGQTPLLVGGGIGSAPLYGLAKRLIAQGRRPMAVLGFNTAAEIVLAEEFAALGVEARLATADGSAGVRGFVTELLPELNGFYCACGPEPMLKAVWTKLGKNGLLSFEERMGCGFGACMGCSCQTLTGFKRICRDGPVLEGGELLW